MQYEAPHRAGKAALHRQSSIQARNDGPTHECATGKTSAAQSAGVRSSLHILLIIRETRCHTTVGISRSEEPAPPINRNDPQRLYLQKRLRSIAIFPRIGRPGKKHTVPLPVQPKPRRSFYRRVAPNAPDPSPRGPMSWKRRGFNIIRENSRQLHAIPMSPSILACRS